jgi:hypothetical protein
MMPTPASATKIEPILAGLPPHRASQPGPERNRADAEQQKTRDRDPHMLRVHRRQLADVVLPGAVPVLQNLGNNPRDGEGDWAQHGKPTEQ